jgi:hypothetical protein
MRVGHEISVHTPHNLIILDLTEFHNKRSNTARTIKLTAMAEKTPQRPGGLKPAANRLAGKVIVVQNCGNVGKPTIGALLQRGCAVRTFTSGDAAKKHAELADMFGLEGDAAAMLRVLKRGDTADETEAFAGAGAFVCIPRLRPRPRTGPTLRSPS